MIVVVSSFATIGTCCSTFTLTGGGGSGGDGDGGGRDRDRDRRDDRV